MTDDDWFEAHVRDRIEQAVRVGAALRRVRHSHQQKATEQGEQEARLLADHLRAHRDQHMGLWHELATTDPLTRPGTRLHDHLAAIPNLTTAITHTRAWEPLSSTATEAKIGLDHWLYQLHDMDPLDLDHLTIGPALTRREHQLRTRGRYDEATVLEKLWSAADKDPRAHCTLAPPADRSRDNSLEWRGRLLEDASPTSTRPTPVTEQRLQELTALAGPDDPYSEQQRDSARRARAVAALASPPPAPRRGRPTPLPSATSAHLVQHPPGHRDDHPRGR